MSSRYLQLVQQARRDIIERALVEAGGSRTKAAEALGMTRTYLQKLARDMGIAAPARRSA